MIDNQQTGAVMEIATKDVIQESAQVVSEKTDIPDGPNVAPSPQEHLAAQGIVQAPLHAGEVRPAELPGSLHGVAADPEAGVPKPMAPGDQAPEGTPGTGENTCPDCGGSGQQGSLTCPTCQGDGVVTVGIGGA